MFPVSAAMRPGGMILTLAPIPAREFTDAFTHQTVARHHGLVVDCRWITRQSLEVPPPLATEHQPAGLIFHGARAGSTLLVRLLRCLDDVTVYSEPQIISQILRAPAEWDPARRMAAIRLVAGHLAAHAGGPYVVKLSSWNVLHINLLLEAFPETPWVMGLRDPLEIAASLVKQPAAWQAWRNAALEEETWLALFLADLFAAAEQADKTRGLLVEYETLPDAAWDSVCRHFGFAPTASQLNAMRAAARLDSKRPVSEQRTFVPDSASKRAMVSPRLRETLSQFTEPALARLRQAFALNPAQSRPQ